MTDSTFAYEDQLPRVPVPTLERSAEQFMEWCAPLLSDAEREETEQAAKSLATSEDGQRLQESLVAYDHKRGVASWLDEFWRDRYLGRRDRIALNADFFFLLHDTGEDQATRAAGLITSAVALKVELDAERIPPATRRGSPLSMVQYKYLFSSTRIPGETRDTARTPYDPDGWTGASPARHIVVIHRGQMFRLDVIGLHGAPHPAEEIKGALEAVLDRSDADGAGVGRLTTLARAEWATTRATLRDHDPVNAAGLEEVESALFCVCLDDDEPGDVHESGDLLLHGDGANRWYDKALSFIVFANGIAGVSVEHCCLDGTTVVSLVDAMADASTAEHEQRSGAQAQGTPEAQAIPFVLDDALASAVSAAQDAFAAYSTEIATTTLTVEVGAEAIKSAGSSPDAFAQMAFQVAHRRAKGHVGATYESIATRGFRHGRTEAMRVVTPESVRLTELIDDPDATDDDRQAALQDALTAHVTRARQCQAGDAPEQHLWELQMIRRRHGAELGVTEDPALYSSAGWRIMRDDYLSTSAVPSPHVRLFGFGATSPQCVGVGYAVHADRFEAYLCTGRSAADQLDTFASEVQRAFPDLLRLLSR